MRSPNAVATCRQAIPLLKSLGEADLRTIAGSLKEAEYTEGKNIIVEGNGCYNRCSRCNHCDHYPLEPLSPL